MDRDINGKRHQFIRDHDGVEEARSSAQEHETPQDQVEMIDMKQPPSSSSLWSAAASFRESLSRSLSLSLSLSLSSNNHHEDDDELELKWAAIERLPSSDRLHTSLLLHRAGGGGDDDDDDGMRAAPPWEAVDVRRLRAAERRAVVENLVADIQRDNLRLLRKQRQRMDRVGVREATVEVRWRDLCVEAECQVVHGKPLPTLWNAAISNLSAVSSMVGLGFNRRKASIRILDNVSGIIKPSRLTLLMGPPGSGKTTLLKALAGKLSANNVKVTGDIEYNGVKLSEFVPEKTAAYIGQYDLHIPELTVRETLDFAARFQGVRNRAEIMKEVLRREEEAGITPDPDIDMYMKATSIEGLERSMQTDYIMKIMGLDICADIMVGDAMRRGISGGEKRRLTTGEMIVGPSKALLMDEISTGLDSSTTFQVISCLQHLAHISESTILVSLLQPAPETYELFDDIILMAEGKIVYHGSKSCIMSFFESCGFKCPERKGAAEFIQEVLSKKDQQQYWNHSAETYNLVTINQFCDKFKTYQVGQNLAKELSKPYDKSKGHNNALSYSIYSLSKYELLKACFTRELLLMKRNAFVYITKVIQLGLLAIITGTVFLRTYVDDNTANANYYMGSLFCALLLLMVNGFPELTMAISRLSIFYKQRDDYFYPAWAYALPSFILKVPISLIESIAWTTLSYFLIGYTLESSRFFRQLAILFLIHISALSLFRCVASYCQTMVPGSVGGTMSFLVILLFGGFIIPRSSMPSWLRWGFWISPLSYAEIGLTGNEFLSPRWLKITVSGVTIGKKTLMDRGLDFPNYFYWLSIGALIGFVMLFNIGFAIGLTIKKAPGTYQAIIPHDKLTIPNRRDQDMSKDRKNWIHKSTGQKASLATNSTGTMVLPFMPHTISFQNVNYYVDINVEMKEQGSLSRKLQLLQNITGAFQPGVLSALMGVTGAGKTTLLDVLAGRKTGGVIEGDIRIGGYPKIQQTFARISGYCEQTDVHSPQMTVGESIEYSAWLRLPAEIDTRTRNEFINQVLEITELDGIRDYLVGISGVNGLSMEQRKRLTIAVELVSNPSIIFMDEPTSGLDARGAAIIMRAVKNVSDTGRTVVCTIHQPSIEIFEAFDELMLMKRGGELIYAGPLGQHSSKVIQYFQAIPGVPKISDNYNPSTWMLDVTSTSMESKLGVNFTEFYRDSTMCKDMDALVKSLSVPPLGTRNLDFPTRFPRKFWEQFKACLWKQYLSYWRTPSYNLVRIMFMMVSSVMFGILFWRQGNINNINDQQGLFTILGCMYCTTIFAGINNCQLVMPFIFIERTVVYREKFAGTYSTWAYSFAQVVMEIPYIFLQTMLFMIIAYPMIGYAWTWTKFLWFFYAMFCTLLYFVYLGMMMVSFMPNIQVAPIFASMFYTIQNLISGFVIPAPQIPKWWKWLYYISPMSWTLNVLFTSQFAYEDEKNIAVFGEVKSVAAFVRDYFGFHRELLPLAAIFLAAFPILFATIFGYSISKLNFQRR